MAASRQWSEYRSKAVVCFYCIFSRFLLFHDLQNSIVANMRILFQEHSVLPFFFLSARFCFPLLKNRLVSMCMSV